MSFIYEALSVSDIAALKALNDTSTPRRVDGVFLVVSDNGTGFPGWYRCQMAASNPENLPSIISSDDNLSRWFQFSGSEIPVSYTGHTVISLLDGYYLGDRRTLISYRRINS